MRKLIKTKDGAYLMRSQILGVNGRSKVKECRVIAADGDTYVVSKFDTDIAEECECFEEAIPAHPGYFMLVTNYSKHCSEIYYSKVPIVGWVRHKTRAEHDLKDITAPFWAIPVFGGEYTFSDRNYVDWALLLPDGTVINPYGLKNDSIETFLETQSAELKKPCLLI